PAPVVMFESPHRVAAALEDMRKVCGDAREVTVARELTKRFEAIDTFALGHARAWLADDAHREQGEFVLILHAPPAKVDTGIPEEAMTWLAALVETVSVRDAARVVAKVTGLPRDQLYEQALALKAARTDEA
ncbi:MAG: 16S rRNA (cytidine(1402)-2'-O)-methyltransferase, partial [Burkholderiaceae bacterium]